MVGQRGGRTRRRRLASLQSPPLGSPRSTYALSIMRDETLDRRERLQAAIAALPFCHPWMGQVQSRGPDPDFVPLAERLKAYARRDAIEAANGNVVEMPRRITSGTSNGEPERDGAAP